MLYDLAREAGADIRCHSKVTKVDLQSISVTVESGETFLADVVIGADGSNSLVRASILTSEITEIPDKHLSLTCVGFLLAETPIHLFTIGSQQAQS